MGQTIEPRSIDDEAPLKVIVIGAGVSGIIAGIRFPQRISNLDLVIYDKNPDIGGTWFENRYPGVACGMALCELLDSIGVDMAPSQTFQHTHIN
jgi:2-polyprenyl-6-methoxyphenol hydroxylase-like FAD-dependent oxidoreductase